MDRNWSSGLNTQTMKKTKLLSEALSLKRTSKALGYMHKDEMGKSKCFIFVLSV